MKLSFYVHMTEIPDSRDLLVYSFLSGTLMVISPEERELLEQGDFDALERKDEFVRAAILTEKDERQVLRETYLAAQHDHSVMKLTIAPTMACNFACEYCFEKAFPGKMSPEIQKALAEFVARMLDHYKSRQLLVAWYGGEPMLCMDMIQNLTQQLELVCREKEVEYSARIVTNGWFFDQTNADILEACHVKEAQITIDGNKEQHDHHRHLFHGGGSYERIVSNLESVRTGIRINIRCNFHRDNLDKGSDLADLIRHLRKVTGNKVYLEPARIVMTPEIIQKKGVTAVREPDPERYLDMLLSLKPKTLIPAAKALPCGSLREVSFGIDPQGNLCKCWEHVGEAAHSIGTIYDYMPESFVEDSFPGDERPCSECPILPVCMGGCPTARKYRNVHRCLPIKSRLDRMILEQYKMTVE